MSYNLEVNTEDSLILHIDSRDATRYLQSDITSYYQYIIKDKITCPENQTLLVSLHSASIPYSFYNIRVGINDTIKIRISDFTSGSSVGPQTATITLPPANYNAFTILDKISELTINAFSTHYSFNFDNTYDADTNKLSFSIIPFNSVAHPSDLNKNLRLEFLFSQDEDFIKSCALELGFRQQDIFMEYNATQIENSIKLISTNCIDINGSIHGIFVRTNLTSKSVLDSQNGNLSNILARIPIDVQAGGILFHRPRDCIHQSLVKSKDVSNLTIKLTDERNNLLDLNGLHFQVGIKIDFLQDKQKIVEKTALERRVAGMTQSSIEEKQLEEALYKESEAERERLSKLVASGDAEVIEDDNTITIKRKTKRVGRPRLVGRPTNKERLRREKIREKQKIKKQQDKLKKASENFYTEDII